MGESRKLDFAKLNQRFILVARGYHRSLHSGFEFASFNSVPSVQGTYSGTPKTCREMRKQC